MCKKLIFLISFVLVASLAGNALALDMCPPVPDFAGGPTAAAVLWEFEDGNAASSEASDLPSIILYNAPEPPDNNFGFRTYGADYAGGTTPNNAFVWSIDGTVVVKGEESVMQPIPAGDGSNLTIQVQVTWQGPNCPMGDGPGIGFELWGGYPNAPPAEGEERAGEWYDGVFNEECTIAISPTAEVNNVEGAWRHTTYDYTFEDFDPEVTHLGVIMFGWEQGTAGMLIDEVVIDMVVHDGDTPPAGPGRPCLRIPRAGQARNPNPAHLEEHVVPTTNLSWEPDPCLAGPLTYDVYFGTDPNMAFNAQIASNIGPCTVDPCAGDLAVGTVFWWRVDTTDANGGGTPVLHTGMNFKFTTWGFADDPEPRNGQAGAEVSTDLSWVKDDYADSFDVYFGTSYTDVNDATTSTAGIYRGGSTGTWVDPCDANNVRYLYDIAGNLDMLKLYYWRIDEINSSVAIKGNIWTFRTEAHFDLEDFDSYLTNTELATVWSDYFTMPDNDGEVYIMKLPDFVQAGHSLQLYYNNTGKKGPKYVGSFTEADVANLEGGTDWTVSGIKALVLNFLGQPGNQATANEKMWVEIEDTSSIAGLVLYDGNPNDVQVPSWHEWNVDCNIFDACGVTLSAVSKIRFGFGGTVRTGQSSPSLGLSTVYFDELELHPIRCVPAVSLPYGDLDGDCNVGAYDVQVMAEDWVEKDYQVFPVPPDRNDLVVEYLFDTDYSDTSGAPFYHGQPSASLTSVGSGYLTIQNVGGYVDVPFGASNPFHGPNDFSIFINYRSDAVAVTALMTSTDPCAPSDWEDPNIDDLFDIYSPMALIVNQAHSGGPSNPDDLTFIYDNFGKGGTEVAISELGGIGAWHSVAATYDADGGTCPSDADPNICPPGTVTGLFTVYFDGTKGPDPLNLDPNIPVDANYDIVRIGDGYNPLHGEDWGFATHIGDFNEVLVYDVALTEAEVYYLSGIVDPTYVANTSVANLVPKSPPGGPYDANNPDIVNFLDYDKLAQRWLTGPYLWP